MNSRHQTIYRLRRNGLTDREIADRLGISPSGLSHWLARNNCSQLGRIGRPMSRETKKALTLLSQGMPLMQAASRAKANWRAVSNARKRKGMASGYKRLDKSKIITDYRRKKKTASEIALENGCAISTVYTYARKTS